MIYICDCCGNYKDDDEEPVEGKLCPTCFNDQSDYCEYHDVHYVSEHCPQCAIENLKRDRFNDITRKHI